MASSKHRPRVLILDDDPDLIEALASLLEEQGYEVHRRGLRNVHDVVDVKPDLLMVDCPPGSKGEVLKFVQQIRLHRETKDIPILLGVTSTKLLEPNVLRERSIQVLVRPFSIDDLLATVGQLLRIQRGPQSS